MPWCLDGTRPPPHWTGSVRRLSWAALVADSARPGADTRGSGVGRDDALAEAWQQVPPEWPGDWHPPQQQHSAGFATAAGAEHSTASAAQRHCHEGRPAKKVATAVSQVMQVRYVLLP
jgi:hypothetical protein